jgi:hypothetical protein
MPAPSTYVNQMAKWAGFVNKFSDPWERVIPWPSPSMNFCFGRGYGLPRGSSVALWGLPKSGKSFIFNAMVGLLHRTDPTAIVVKWDSEYRSKYQLTAQIVKAMGIDMKRYVIIEGNKPIIFDQMCKVEDMIKNGANIPLMCVDSTTMILGRREAESETIMTQQRGDQAMTVQLGLQRFIGIQKENDISLVLMQQARAEMDQQKVKRGEATKMAAAFGVQHHCEFFLNVEKNSYASGSKDDLENKLENVNRPDILGNGEQTGHRIRMWMQDSSMGPKNRQGELTIDYNHGVIMPHQEIFKLCHEWDIITTRGAWYKFDGKEWNGKAKILGAMEADLGLQTAMFDALKAQDNKIPELTREQAAAKFQVDFDNTAEAQAAAAAWTAEQAGQPTGEAAGA